MCSDDTRHCTHSNTESTLQSSIPVTISPDEKPVTPSTIDDYNNKKQRLISVSSYKKSDYDVFNYIILEFNSVDDSIMVYNK